jgi:hypothetical protein
LEKPVIETPIEEVIPGKLSWGASSSQQIPFRPAGPTHAPAEMSRQEFRNLIKDIDNQISTAPKGVKSNLIELRKQASDFLESKMNPDELASFKKSNEMYVDKYDLEDIFGPEIFKNNLQASDIEAITSKISKLHGYGGEASDKAQTAFDKGINILKKYPQFKDKAEQLATSAQKHSKLWALSSAGQQTSPSNITGSLQSMLLRGAAAVGHTKGLATEANKPINDLLKLGGQKINQLADNVETKSSTTANFLRNFSNADVSKKKAMLFSASQNPDLRKHLSETSELEE